MLNSLEQQIKVFQQLKFPKTRGPNGFYSEIKRKLAIAEEERKANRRLDFEKSLLNPVRKIDSAVNMSLKIGSVSSLNSIRVNDSDREEQIESNDSDTNGVFEMDLEEIPKKPATPAKKTFKRFDLKKEQIDQTLFESPRTPKSWKQTPASPEVGSFKSIMELEKRGNFKDSILSPPNSKSNFQNVASPGFVGSKSPPPCNPSSMGRRSVSDSFISQIKRVSITEKSPARSVSTTAPTLVIKTNDGKSQKERRRSSKIISEDALSGVIVEDAPGVTKPPWAALPSPKTPKSPLSFHDIQGEQEKAKKSWVFEKKSMLEIQAEQESVSKVFVWGKRVR